MQGAKDGIPEDRTLIIQCPRGRNGTKWKNASVKSGRWRLTGTDKLYDINADPRQKINVAADHPDVVKRLTRAYETYWADLPDPAATLSRHVLGAKECPDVVLNGMDWYQGSSPWNRGHMESRRGGNGVWATTIQRDGKYVFECRQYPREADKAMNATRAKIQIADSSWGDS